jgi:hypothetical protein
VTVPEIKAFYGLLILMDVMKFEREELYWSDNKEFPLVRSKFGEIMPHDRFVQIKPYPHFSDDAGNNQGDKLRLFQILRVCLSYIVSFLDAP